MDWEKREHEDIEHYVMDLTILLRSFDRRLNTLEKDLSYIRKSLTSLWDETKCSRGIKV